jgi:hypothetical protein
MLGLTESFHMDGLLTFLVLGGMCVVLFLWPFVALLLKIRTMGQLDLEDWHKRSGWPALGMAAGMLLRQFMGETEWVIAVMLALLMWGAAGVIKRG